MNNVDNNNNNNNNNLTSDFNFSINLHYVNPTECQPVIKQKTLRRTKKYYNIVTKDSDLIFPNQTFENNMMQNRIINDDNLSIEFDHVLKINYLKMFSFEQDVLWNIDNFLCKEYVSDIITLEIIKKYNDEPKTLQIKLLKNEKFPIVLLKFSHEFFVNFIKIAFYKLLPQSNFWCQSIGEKHFIHVMKREKIPKLYLENCYNDQLLEEEEDNTKKQVEFNTINSVVIDTIRQHIVYSPQSLTKKYNYVMSNELYTFCKKNNQLELVDFEMINFKTHGKIVIKFIFDGIVV